MLGAPPYPMRNPGFTGPDPYDPQQCKPEAECRALALLFSHSPLPTRPHVSTRRYGPDTPEPRPFKNPGFEMCRTLLENYNGLCAFPGNVG